MYNNETVKCDCYSVTDYGDKVETRCNGTRERDFCNCGGDRTQCDFYSDVREKAIAAKNSEDTSRILKDFGVLDEQGHLSQVYREIYELRKRQLSGAKIGTVWNAKIKPLKIDGDTYMVNQFVCETCDFSIPTNKVNNYVFCPRCGREITYNEELANMEN